MKISTLQTPHSPARWPLLCLAMFMTCFIFTLLVPSFQAPDEFDHVNRAYMLSRGHILLHSNNGSPSGGEVDQGLVEYMAYFTPLKQDPNYKVSADENTQAAGTPWERRSRFVTAVGTAYYFPALYAPAAIGLAVGEALHLSVGQSYRLARFLTLGACFALLLTAFRIFPPPMLLLAVLALPMNLFLMASPVLDGMATCVTIVAISAFMRLLSDRGQTSVRLIYLLAATVAAVTACRANLLPLLSLPFAAWWLHRTRPALICAIAVAALVLAWTMYTVKFTVYPPGARNVDHGARLARFLIHPWELSRIVYATLTNEALTNFYLVSFIGVLGWLDAPFSPMTYYVLEALLGLVVVFSVSARAVESHRLMRGLLLLCAVGAVLLTFLALLVQWTVGPAITVDGVQGRYFTIPVIVTIYALFAYAEPRAGLSEIARTVLTVGILMYSTYVTSLLLINRYYLQQVQPDPRNVVAIVASPSLTHDRPITIHFPSVQIAIPDDLDRIALRFGTYMTKHPGKAALVLHTDDEQTLRLPFELSALADNNYKSFDLDGKRYTRGEIVSEGGEGISTYEARTGDGLIEDCMHLRTRGGRVRTTPGCPPP